MITKQNFSYQAWKPDRVKDSLTESSPHGLWYNKFMEG